MGDWLREMFGVEKPVIGMCHLRALPGDPGYDAVGGLGLVVEDARGNLRALQEGGVDGVMFSNEFSMPYMTKVGAVTVGSMARVIAELYGEIGVPFGVNVLWDPYASLDLAVASGALFAREIFTGVYASDFGLWDTDCGSVVRHQQAIGGGSVRLLFNILPEGAVYLGGRDIASVARSTVFNARPDGLCLSGLTAGRAASMEALRVVKDALPDAVVFANTGVNAGNIEEQLGVADGAIVGTAFKEGGVFENRVDAGRTRALMEKARGLRGG